MEDIGGPILAKKVIGEDTDNPAILMAVIGPMGSVNGYMMVEKDSKWFGLDYEEMNENCVVHGGWTYSRSGKKFAEMVAFLPNGAAAIIADMWVFGFDTLHAGDAISEEYAAYSLDNNGGFSRTLLEARLMSFGHGHVWTPDEVMEELDSAYGQLVGK